MSHCSGDPNCGLGSRCPDGQATRTRMTKHLSRDDLMFLGEVMEEHAETAEGHEDIRKFVGLLQRIEMEISEKENDG